MKKSITKIARLSLLVISVALALSSCTKEYYEDSTIFDNVYFTVEAKDWVWDKEAGAYHYEADVPEITSNAVEYGVVVIALELQNSLGQDINQFKLMPFTLPIADNLTETFDAEYGRGFVDIYVTQSDFSQVNPGRQTFKISAVYK